jgi:hypothetical protein
MYADRASMFFDFHEKVASKLMQTIARSSSSLPIECLSQQWAWPYVDAKVVISRPDEYTLHCRCRELHGDGNLTPSPTVPAVFAPIPNRPHVLFQNLSPSPPRPRRFWPHPHPEPAWVTGVSNGQLAILYYIPSKISSLNFRQQPRYI